MPRKETLPHNEISNQCHISTLLRVRAMHSIPRLVNPKNFPYFLKPAMSQLFCHFLKRVSFANMLKPVVFPGLVSFMDPAEALASTYTHHLNKTSTTQQIELSAYFCPRRILTQAVNGCNSAKIAKCVGGVTNLHGAPKELCSYILELKHDLGTRHPACIYKSPHISTPKMGVAGWRQ